MTATPRNIMTVPDLLANSDVDPVTGCWLWKGPFTTAGAPTVYTIDHRKGIKRTMSGAMGVWSIAHGCAPKPGWLVGRRCQSRTCMRPACMVELKDRKVLGKLVAHVGRQKGKDYPKRRQSLAKAWEASGQVNTTPDKVKAIREADAAERTTHLAARLGMKRETVRKIRVGQSHTGAYAGAQA